MRLDRALVARGLVSSRSEALEAIKAGLVRIDGAPARKASQTCSDDTDLVLTGAARRYVSRAGDKLAHALHEFGVPVAGRHALDLGSSTGGFTQVLLEAGAQSVTSVDVGRDQLADSLRGHPKLRLFESTDVRELTADHLLEAPSLVTADLSFIALHKALPHPLSLAAPGTDLIALVKPQFEVGRDGIGKGGLVRDEALQLGAVDNVSDALRGLGWDEVARCDSPILGGDGNREFLIHARKRV